MDMFRLDGKRALITGGSKGIGLGIAEGMAAAGADLVLIARNEPDLEAVRLRLKDAATSVATYPFDMQQTDEIADIYARIVADQGGVDILVNNAGTTRRAPAEDVDLDDWRAVVNLNLTSVFAICRAFARERIAARKPGRIINIASVFSEAVRGVNAPYAASKGGIRQLTKALAVDWAPHGINVNAVGPGFIQTPLTQPLWEDPTFTEWIEKRTPLARWGTPADLAGAAVFLASDASEFVTGQILYVDGGWLATF
jgi:gluconate 5-dehydrogenase